jgi:hypothetical protein
LADNEFPNAGKMLFGDDLPPLAAKQSEMSRSLSKNLQKPQYNPQNSRQNSKQVHIVTYRLNLNGLFVAHLGKEARGLGKTAIRIFETSGASKAARLSLFLSQWQKITKDPVIIAIVRGYQIDFHTKP